jgi:katanin p60 ATPase-containing subunit A1
MQINKFEYESKIVKEKKENERRKNILVLILRYLVNMGMAESAFKLQEEANLDIEKFDVADNIDLYIITCEYEEYFELKFGKKPKLVNKINDADSVNKLPNIRNSSKTTINSVNNGQDKKSQKGNLSNKGNMNKLKENGNAMNTLNTVNDAGLKLELTGQPMNLKKKEELKENKDFTFNDQKESILLKPIPDNMFGNAEMKELASLVRR